MKNRLKGCAFATIGVFAAAACTNNDNPANEPVSAPAHAPSVAHAERLARNLISTPKPIPTTPRHLAPAPSGPGCYEHSAAGWQATPCTDGSTVATTFGRPEFPPDLSAPINASGVATIPLVFGEVQTTFAAVGTVTDIPQGDDWIAADGTPNQWSIQNNTNYFIGSNGQKDWVQFTVQSDGTNNALCIWNIDVQPNPANYGTPTCKTVPQRPGGLQPGDSIALAATAQDGVLTMNVQLSWAASGESDQWTVSAPDTYGLAGNWWQVSGGVLGRGNSSSAMFTDAEVWTSLAVSTCAGDTQAGDATCPDALALQPTITVGNGDTSDEGNNLVDVGPESVAYPNTQLAVSNYVETTTGTCLTTQCAADYPLAAGAPSCTYTSGLDPIANGLGVVVPQCTPDAAGDAIIIFQENGAGGWDAVDTYTAYGSFNVYEPATITLLACSVHLNPDTSPVGIGDTGCETTTTTIQIPVPPPPPPPACVPILTPANYCDANTCGWTTDNGCGSSFTCPACQCIPTSCEAVGAVCGYVYPVDIHGDACGQPIECKACPSGESCSQDRTVCCANSETGANGADGVCCATGESAGGGHCCPSGSHWQIDTCARNNPIHLP
jgi:hypothetical protein